MDLYQMLAESLVADDNGRDRSQQTEIGASSVGGCRRQAWHIIQQTPKTNNQTEPLAAILGTAIHSHIAEVIKYADPFGDNFVIEGEVFNDKLKGHVDLYIRSSKTVVDWKTKTLKGLERFPSAQEKMQVSLYASLLIESGSPVERVALVGIPRDGKLSDIKVWEADYDQKIADKGFAWLEDIYSRTEAPDPEKPVAFCANYCSYYDESGVKGCPGKN